MPSFALPGLLLLAAPLLLAAGLTACGGDSSPAGSGTEVVAVTAKDDACTLSQTELPAGSTTFAVTNDGSKVTEVYVYAKSGDAFTKVLSEVENIGPGTSRDLDVDLSAGSYEVACKPGQKGDGIRQKITVTGASAGSDASGSSASYHRELELSVDDSGLTGLDPATAHQGERIEFKLENETDGTRTFELKDPAGKVATEFDVPAGRQGEAVVELAGTGAWTVIIEGGAGDIEQTLTVGR
jgi:iron uptake system component EfeO